MASNGGTGDDVLRSFCLRFQGKTIVMEEKIRRSEEREGNQPNRQVTAAGGEELSENKDIDCACKRCCNYSTVQYVT